MLKFMRDEMKIKTQNVKEESSYYVQEFEKEGQKYRTAEWDENRKLKLLNSIGVFNIKGLNILDFGCGTATFTPHLKKSFKNVIGLDVAMTNLKIAINLDDISKYICGDGNNLPFKDETFDAVFCGAVLHHFPDIIAPLREINRVLRKGGFLFAAEPNNWNPLAIVQRRKSSNPLTHKGHSQLTFSIIEGKSIESGFTIFRKRSVNFTPPEIKGIWKLAKLIEPYIESLPLINMFGGTLLVSAMKVKNI